MFCDLWAAEFGDRDHVYLVTVVTATRFPKGIDLGEIVEVE